MDAQQRHVFMNRLANCKNRFQGGFKKVLCVCSAGLLRSPTTALILAQEPYSYNTRAAGIVDEYALIPVDEVLLDWCDEVVCMEDWQGQKVESLLKEKGIFNADGSDKLVKVLGISDSYPYRNPELIELIKERYNGA